MSGGKAPRRQFVEEALDLGAADFRRNLKLRLQLRKVIAFFGAHHHQFVADLRR